MGCNFQLGLNDNNEEKAEVLHAFFASVLNSKTSCIQGTQCPEQEDRNREQDEAPVIHKKRFSDLSCHLKHLHVHRAQGNCWKSSLSHSPPFTSSSG